VPYHAGDDRDPASAGPRRLVAAGAGDVLASRGHRVYVDLVDRGSPFRDTASSSADVNREVARKVQTAHASGQLPLTLAGSCVTCQGVLAGFDHAGCGAVWIDGHADFNTPDTTASGFFPGMSLSVATGHCFQHYWGTIGDNTPLREEAIVMLGLREVFPAAERERLERSSIEVVEWRRGEPQRDPVGALEQLAGRVGDVYLHVDFDAFAPDVAPGVADEPLPGGLSREDAELIIRATGERFRIRAVTLATFTPARDRDGRTLELGLRLIETIGNHASPPAPSPRDGRN
jgi:arginase